jgi:hypothetical protein
MVNGEVIVAEVECCEADDIVKVRNPLQLQVVPTGIDSSMVVITSWIPSTEERDFTFDSKHILCVVTPSNSMLGQYKNMTSDIAVPEEKKLVVP